MPAPAHVVRDSPLAVANMPCLLRNSPRTRVPCRPALLEGLKRELPPKYTIKGGPRGGECGTVGYGSFHPAAPTLTRMAYRHAAHAPSACCNVELSHAALPARQCMPPTEPPSGPTPTHCTAVVTPQDSPQSSWIRVYTAFGMADLFGAHDE